MSNNLIELLEKLTGNMELNLGGLRDQLRAELAALKAGQGEAVAEVSPESYSSDGTSDIITRNLPIGTKLYKAPPTATIQGEANRRPQTCNGRRCSWCKEGADPCHYTAPPATGDAVSVPVAMPERWEDRLSRMHQTIQAGCWPKRWVDDAKDYELGELRALLAAAPSAKQKESGDE